MSEGKPWLGDLSPEQFSFLQRVLAAPSPVGLEGGMTFGVIEPYWRQHRLPGWGFHRFRGNASLVLDTHPHEPERFTVMVVGHADKIRLQVRSIGSDGKVWVNSDSFLPATLIGHKVVAYCRQPDDPSSWRALRGGTIEALGAIHFASPEIRSGRKGIGKDKLYLELHVHGEDRREQVRKLGIRPGDPILVDRRLERGVFPRTLMGPYLDDGLGCFVTAELARLLAERGGTERVRMLFAITTHEEIGRMGSRVLAGELHPDVLVAVDANHDYVAAPGVSDRNFPPLAMGEGFTLDAGSVVSDSLSTRLEKLARDAGIPLQHDVAGRDTGTDAMAAVFAAVDAAVLSVGVPVRNMHTVSEAAHAGDILSALHALEHLVHDLDGDRAAREALVQGHTRLDLAGDANEAVPPASSSVPAEE